MTEVANLIRVETTNLAAAALPSGPGGGNALYDATPGTGAWGTAPDAAAVATYSPPFTAESWTVLVRTAAVEIRISSDDAANYGDWIVLPPGSYSFELSMTDVQVREDVDGGGGEYQIVVFS